MFLERRQGGSSRDGKLSIQLRNLIWKDQSKVLLTHIQETQKKMLKQCECRKRPIE